MMVLMREWTSGNQSREDFCNDHGLTLSTFGYWRTQYRKQTDPQAACKGFIQLTTIPQSRLEVVYPNGVMVRLADDCSLAQLRSLIDLV